jgi:hypothetical protein
MASVNHREEPSFIGLWPWQRLRGRRWRSFIAVVEAGVNVPGNQFADVTDRMATESATKHNEKCNQIKYHIK